MTRGRPGSAFGKPLNVMDGERTEFERIACELEQIAAWLRVQDPNSEHAKRLFEQARQLRSDSHLPRE
jgi:hypothetical protein